MGFVNFKSNKYHLIIGILLSVIGSYVSFFIGYLSIGLVGAIFSFLGNDLQASLGLQISPYVIAPLVFYIIFSYLYVVKRDIKFFIVLMISIILLLTIINLFKDDLNFELRTGKFFLPFILWPLIISIGFQLVLCWNEVFEIGEKRNFENRYLE